MIENTVVAEALRLLTSRVNVARGLTHPNDKAAAVKLLRLLISAGEQFEPEELKVWASRHGWSQRGANQLYAVASALVDGRTVRTNRLGGWKPDIVETLRERARRHPGQSE